MANVKITDLTELSSATTTDVLEIVSDPGGSPISKKITVENLLLSALTALPAFLVKPTSAQSNIAVGSAVTVVWGTEIKDQKSNFASNVFTAPVTGMYQLNLLLILTGVDTASEYYEIDMVTSNRTYTVIYDSNTEASADPSHVSVVLSILADMDAGDTAHVQVTQGGGTQQTAISGSSYFSGFLAVRG